MTDSESVRFWQKVIPTDGCWHWTGAVLSGAPRSKCLYGQFWVCVDGKRKSKGAHVVSYEHFKGPIPSGLVVDHLCKNTGCVNPEHLEAVTVKENNARSNSPTAIKGRMTHCHRGHPLSGDNLVVTERRRICVECSKLKTVRRRAQYKEKMMRKALSAFAVVVALMSPCVSRAQEAATVAPLFSAKRISLATGASYCWRTTPLANNSEPLLGRHAEWEAGVFGAYNLTPHASLVGSTTLGIDSRQFRHTLGVRLRIWQGSK